MNPADTFSVSTALPPPRIGKADRRLSGATLLPTGTDLLVPPAVHGSELPVVNIITDGLQIDRLVSLTENESECSILNEVTDDFGACLLVSPAVHAAELPVIFEVTECAHLISEPPLTCGIIPDDALLQAAHAEVSDAFDLDFPPVSLIGMSYADKHWKKISNPVVDSENAPSRNKPESAGKRKTRKEKKLKDTKAADTTQPNFWDLLYVILKPPLSLADTTGVQLPHQLFPYQREGVSFLVDRESALLADDMGTGKTVMTIVALRVLAQKGQIVRALILCPPSVLYEWRRHLEEWSPEFQVQFVRGTKAQRTILWQTDAHIYVTTYHTLRSDMESKVLPPEKHDVFDVIVVDEAHNIKNPDAAISRAIRKLRARRRWALTGTPLQNSERDLLAIFRYLRADAYKMSWEWNHVQFMQSVQTDFLRRRKQDVLSELPPKQSQEIWLELDEEQRKLYDEAEGRIRKEIQQLGEHATDFQIESKFRTSLNELKQICNFAKGRASSPKLDILKEQIEEIVSSGHKVIVFSQYIDEGVEKLQFALHPYGTAVIRGGQSEKLRFSEIDTFKRSSNIHVLIASVRAGGEGLNLVEASYVVHFDHWWNPAVMWQAEDRVHRRGQKLGVNVYSYWVADTIDERIHAILERKRHLFRMYVDDLALPLTDEEGPAALSADEIREILGIPARSPRLQQPSQSLRQRDITEVRERLTTLEPQEFEELSKNLLKHLGLENARVTGRSGDGGIDVLAVRNTEQGVERIAAQCKRWRGGIGVSVARDFLGAMQDQSIQQGILVGASEFSDECLQFCQKHNIKAISGLELAKYVIQFGLPV